MEKEVSEVVEERERSGGGGEGEIEGGRGRVGSRMAEG